jgi:hypothetical protein
MIARVCRCGFSTTDFDWFNDHIVGRPDHYEQSYSRRLWVIWAERESYRRRRQATS